MLGVVNLLEPKLSQLDGLPCEDVGGIGQERDASVSDERMATALCSPLLELL